MRQSKAAGWLWLLWGRTRVLRAVPLSQFLPTQEFAGERDVMLTPMAAFKKNLTTTHVLLLDQYLIPGKKPCENMNAQDWMFTGLD